MQATWRRPLSKVQSLKTLCQERIGLIQSELEEALQDRSTHIYALSAIGYGCIQNLSCYRHDLCERIRRASSFPVPRFGRASS